MKVGRHLVALVACLSTGCLDWTYRNPSSNSERGGQADAWTLSDGGLPAADSGPPLEMVKVPSGTFMMGCNHAIDEDCSSNEDPYHAVNVPEFEIDRTEVTWSAYLRFTAATGTPQPAAYSRCIFQNGADYPVFGVSPTEARVYCAWASKALCSEAQWEKAARGTDGRKYPWGNEPPTCQRANFGACTPADIGQPLSQPVATHPAGASPYGALDMAGNAYEWIEDDCHDTYNGAPADGTAWIDSPRSSSSCALVRGGAFGYHDVRASLRTQFGPGNFDIDSECSHGFRCCRSAR
jgi:formylglycine-generating enzyme required for sulfatase activity